MLRAAYQAFLTAEGLHALAVTNGGDCLAALRQAPPDVLIIDPELPEGAGGALLDVLRQAGEAPAVRVLILTSHPETVTAEALPGSDYGVLIKPVPPATVAAVVRSLGEAELIHAVGERV